VCNLKQGFMSSTYKAYYIVTDLLGALLSGGPGGRVLVCAPCNSTVEVFPSSAHVPCHTTHGQVTSHNSV
jgi:hypothetical protein